MKRRSHSENLRKNKHNPEETCKAFKDISKYFSKEEWAKLSHSEKITYVYMKRNYTTMTNLGLRAHLPDFMESKKQVTKSVLSNSDEVSSHDSQGLRRRPVSIWSHRLRKRKRPVIDEDISNPKEDDEDKEEEEEQEQEEQEQQEEKEEVEPKRKKSRKKNGRRKRKRKRLVLLEKEPCGVRKNIIGLKIMDTTLKS